MSEDKTHPYPGELLYNNKKITNFVARVNANELANLIEKEWINWYNSDEQNPSVLPEDLYVFDESMMWLIIFTHESAYVDPQKYSRHCIVHTEE